MPNRSADELFLLIKTLEKGEKRNFKLYVGRNAATDDLKIITLFDAIDKADVYDEECVLRRNPTIQKQQLSNLKAHLYKQILASLRLIRNEQSVDMQLHEQLDYARMLYNKGLYHQSLKMLQKTKDLAKQYHQMTFWLQALFFEKKIETLHITRSFEDRAELLTQEVEDLNERLTMVGKLSSLALQLYGWYIKNGHIRDEKDEVAILKVIRSKPTIVVVNLQRPAVIPTINAESKALIADFSSQDNVILDLIFGKFSPQGHLPFELPSSMEAVLQQKEDLPYDSKNPLYPFGFGLQYQR